MENNNITVEQLMKASLGELSNKLKVAFKKTVKVKEYETEVIEASNEVELDEEVSGAQRIIISAILKTQLEYMVYCDLVFKGTVTQKEFSERKQVIESSMTELVRKATSLGIDVSKYIKEQL